MQIPNNESAAGRFKRLATYRTNVVLDKIRILSNCANKQLYEFQEDEIEKMFRAIEHELKTARTKFHSNGKRKFEL